jgi:SAM-dependent methyltransferase
LLKGFATCSVWLGADGCKLKNPMREVPCPVCDSYESTTLYQVRDRETGVPGEFEMVRCLACGSAYLNPQPTAEELASYYPQSYAQYLDYVAKEPAGFRRQLRDKVLHDYKRYPFDPKLQGWQAVIATLAAPLLQHRFHNIPLWRAKTNHRILDVGCGNGYYLRKLKQLGWETYGVDPNPYACQVGSHELEIRPGDLRSANFGRGFFDRVRYWHVLEHVPDLRAELREARRVLRDGGILHLAVPVGDTLPIRLFGPHYTGISAPRHLVLPAKRALYSILTQEGFSIVRVRHTLGAQIVLESCLNVLESVRGEDFEPAEKRRLTSVASPKKTTSAADLAVFALRIFISPACWLLAAMGQGVTVELECVKGKP